MITVKVSDLRKMVEELEKKEIKYADVEYLEVQKFNGDIFPTSLKFNAYDCLGNGMEFGDIENIKANDMQEKH